VSNLVPVTTEERRQNEIIQLVSFELANEEYGIDVLAVREIIRVPTITQVPNTNAALAGIVNLRGTVVPIVSLRQRFGLEDRAKDRSSRILVMEVGEGLTGFVVDAVAEVIRVSAAEIQPPPSMLQGQTAQEYITGVINRAERLLVVLDLNKLFSADEKAELLQAG